MYSLEWFVRGLTGIDPQTKTTFLLQYGTETRPKTFFDGK